MSEPTIRLLATDKDLTPGGERIFGGWTMANADLAASILAVQIADGSVVTAYVDSIKFLKPISVGDVVSFYTSLGPTKNTSMEIEVEVIVDRSWGRGIRETVAIATFTFVSVDEKGKPRPLQFA